MNKIITKKQIQSIVKLYNNSLSKHIDGLCSNGVILDQDTISCLKMDILMGGLDYCYSHVSKFDPTKGNSISYFATVFKIYVMREIKILRKDKMKIIQNLRDRRINDLLGIKNVIGSEMEAELYNM